MMFEVVAESWDYQPSRCKAFTYFKGEKGFLPEKVVQSGIDSGHLVRIDNA